MEPVRTLCRLAQWPRRLSGTRSDRARERVSGGMALRAARAVGVPVEEVLAGNWSKPGM